jgi:polyisoprenoid-binding protein YceI
MRRYISNLGQSCARALLVRGESTSLEQEAQPVQRTETAQRQPALARHTARARSRAILTAAIAASLLLPFASNSATIAAAAAPLSPAATVRTAAAQDGLIHVALIPGESEARYIMTIQTLGQPPKQAACTTRSVTGEIVLNSDGSVVSELSKIVVDQRTLKCAAPLRDQQAQSLLQTAQHPLAEFMVKSTPGIGLPLPEGDAAFQLVGDQTVRGVTQPATYETQATFTPDMMVGKARTTLPMSSFGIKPPSIGPLLQVSDDMIAEVDIKAMIGGGPAAGAPAPATDPATAADPAAGDVPAGEPTPAEDAT